MNAPSAGLCPRSCTCGFWVVSLVLPLHDSRFIEWLLLLHPLRPSAQNPRSKRTSSRRKGLGSEQTHLLLAPRPQRRPCLRLAQGPSCFREETRRAGCPSRRLFPKPARPVVTSQPGPGPIPGRRLRGPGLLALPFLQHMDQGLRLGSCLDLLAAQGNLGASKASPLQLPLSCSVKSIDAL